jgi:hypothetical protein
MKYEDWKRTFVDGGAKKGLAKNISLPSEMMEGTEIPQDIQQEIKRAIEQAQSEYDIRVDEIAYTDISSQGKIPLQFNPINNAGNFKSQLIINKGYDWNRTLDELNARIYNKNYIKGKPSSQNLEDLIYHELAHFMTFQDCNTWSDFLLKERIIRHKFIEGISLYNDVSEDGAETIAEAFVALLHKRPVPEEAEKLVAEQVKRWKK